jgi:O-acetyl-ADP-ribose deacetylase (regulator of RNase III)
MLWRASERSICDSVRNAVSVARASGMWHVAMPVIGAGSGGFGEARALGLIVRTLAELPEYGRATVVRYRR